MALPINVALVTRDKHVSSHDLLTVAAALQEQVTSDFAPIWGITANVQSFDSPHKVPLGYWPIIVVNNLPPTEGGFHLDKHGQPYAMVEVADDWSVAASHELLEMLVDPFGNRLTTANLLQQAVGEGLPRQKVNYLVEVCDPCEANQFSYNKSNGVQVSDFITPRFYDPQTTSGVAYSFTRAILQPLSILEDGYISWQDGLGNWMQLKNFGGNLQVVDLGANGDFAKSREQGKSLRESSDLVTRPHQFTRRNPKVVCTQGNRLELLINRHCSS